MKKMIAAAAAVLALSAQPVLASDNDTWIGSDVVALTEEIGMRNHVCPEILQAIIEMESSGQQYARNGTCHGLMQVNLTYAGERMRRLGVTDIYDKRQNIETGCDLLLELYETYGDDTYYILTRYAGYADADKRRAEQNWPYYAKHIVDRAEYLERCHGK